MSLLDLTALELGAAIKKGETTAVEAAESCFARMKEMESEVHALSLIHILWYDYQALKSAENSWAIAKR